MVIHLDHIYEMFNSFLVMFGDLNFWLQHLIYNSSFSIKPNLNLIKYHQFEKFPLILKNEIVD
jgi:hypothetical protein